MKGYKVAPEDPASGLASRVALWYLEHSLEGWGIPCSANARWALASPLPIRWEATGPSQDELVLLKDYACAELRELYREAHSLAGSIIYAQRRHASTLQREERVSGLAQYILARAREYTSHGPASCNAGFQTLDRVATAQARHVMHGQRFHELGEQVPDWESLLRVRPNRQCARVSSTVVWGDDVVFGTQIPEHRVAVSIGLMTSCFWRTEDDDVIAQVVPTEDIRNFPNSRSIAPTERRPVVRRVDGFNPVVIAFFLLLICLPTTDAHRTERCGFTTIGYDRNGVDGGIVTVCHLPYADELQFKNLALEQSWACPVTSSAVSPGPHMLFTLGYRVCCAMIEAASAVSCRVRDAVREWEVEFGIDAASLVFVVCVTVVCVVVALVLIVKLIRAAAELAEAERLVGEAAPLKESVVRDTEIVYTDEGVFIRAIVGDGAFLVPCTSEIKMEMAFGGALPPKVSRGGPEMAIGGHPRLETKAPGYLVHIVAGDRVRGQGFRCGNMLVTSKHVLRACASYPTVYMVSPNANKQVELLREWSSPLRAIGLDIATVAVPPAVWAVMGVSKARIATARDGETVTAYGRNHFGKVVESKGVARAQSLFVLSHTCSSEKGDSGGPVVSKRGVIAVHWGARAEDGVNHAVTLDILKDVAETDAWSSDLSESPEMFHERHEARDEKRQESDFLSTLREAQAGIGGRLVVLRATTQSVEAYRADGTKYIKTVLAHSLDEFRGPSWADMEDEERPDGGEEADDEPEPFSSSVAAEPQSRPFRADQTQVLVQVPSTCATPSDLSGPTGVSSVKEESDLRKLDAAQPPSQPTVRPRKPRRGKSKRSSSSQGSPAMPGPQEGPVPNSVVSSSRPPAMTWAQIHQARGLRASSTTLSASTPALTSPTTLPETNTATASVKTM